jgi:nucleoside-diphosphate-sugar epimerase
MFMKVFLTGSTGFVGGALLGRLRSKLHEVKALVRKRADVLPNAVEQVVGDLALLVQEVANQVEHDAPQTVHGDLFLALSACDVVVHAAARAHIMRDEAVDPLTEYRTVNRDATLALARLAAQAGVKRFVFLSSIKVNGEMTRPGESFSPEDCFVPTDPYGLSKYEAEQGLLALAQETGLEVVIIRPPLVYGLGAKGNFASMANWLKKGVPLPFGAVHNLRSLVALDNLVDFIALCADRARSPNAANEVFLIADGQDVSTTELLRKVAKYQNKQAWLWPIPVSVMRFAARSLGKGAVADRLFGNLQVDSSKARNVLNWTPVVTMDEALARMFRTEIR